MPEVTTDPATLAEALRPTLLQLGRELRRVRSRRTAWLATRLRGLTPEQLAAIEAAIEPLSELL